MSFLSRVVFFAAIATVIHCEQPQLAARGLLEPTIEEIIAIIEKLLGLGGEPGPVDQNELELWLYNQNNREIPIIFDTNDTSHINTEKNVILIISGWNSSPNTTDFQALKDAYVARYTDNILMLNWTLIEQQNYATAVYKLPYVANYVGAFFCLLNQQFGYSMSNVHIVGHSLGGQMGGYIGQYTKEHCGQTVGRITGMDPAGPGYEGALTSYRLDASDATRVDVMHCNEGEFGYLGNCGSVDFHVNCGSFQTGCPSLAAALGILVTNPSSFPDAVACSHSRCTKLMTESVNSDKFVAKSCRGCPLLCLADNNPTFAIMGEDCPANPPSTKYKIPTAGSSPFALGCPPNTVEC